MFTSSILTPTETLLSVILICSNPLNDGCTHGRCSICISRNWFPKITAWTPNTAVVIIPTMTSPRVHLPTTLVHFAISSLEEFVTSLALFVAIAAPGYDRGNKYRASQYQIENPISFGLIFVVFILVAQAIDLVLLSSTDGSFRRFSIVIPN